MLITNEQQMSVFKYVRKLNLKTYHSNNTNNEQ